MGVKEKSLQVKVVLLEKRVKKLEDSHVVEIVQLKEALKAKKKEVKFLEGEAVE